MRLRKFFHSLAGRSVRILLLPVLFVGINAPAANPEPQEPLPRTGRGAQGGYRRVGVTAPAKVAVLSSTIPGRLVALPMGEGEAVAVDEIVVVLDDGIQQARTEIAKAEAESDLTVELAKARWEHAQRDLERLAKLHGDDFVSSKELNDARSEREIRRLEFELARVTQALAVRAFHREQEILRQFRMRAPFAGLVAVHQKHVGESVDVGEAIVTVVQLDPLEIALDCPVALAPLIRKGDKVEVCPVDEQWGPRSGDVTLVSRVADAASQTFKVKVAVENRDGGWMSGLKVVVDLGKCGRADVEVGSSRAADFSQRGPSCTGTSARTEVRSSQPSDEGRD